jgi:hypothetical protein
MEIAIGFVVGVVLASAFSGVLVWWLVGRCRVLEDQRDSMAIQLQNALLELRTDLVIEMASEPEPDEEGD